MNIALVMIAVIAVFVLWAIQNVASSLHSISESLDSISKELRFLNSNEGEDGVNPKSPLHNAAWSLRLIARVLETETNYYEKSQARIKAISDKAETKSTPE